MIDKIFEIIIYIMTFITKIKENDIDEISEIIIYIMTSITKIKVNDIHKFFDNIDKLLDNAVNILLLVI